MQLIWKIRYISSFNIIFCSDIPL